MERKKLHVDQISRVTVLFCTPNYNKSLGTHYYRFWFDRDNNLCVIGTQ